MALESAKAPFSHPDWLFELKYDGFRALAHIDGKRTQLVSRNGHPFASFWVQALDRGLDKFEAQKLRTPEELPEIGEDNFNLIWDFEAAEDYGRTLIKHGDVVIFSEPARWEESRRFKEVAEILKAKYGDRIKDLVPTEGSKLNLYGDDGKSPGFVDNVRAWFFGANTTPREGTWSGKKPATPATPPATAAKPAAKPAASSEFRYITTAKATARIYSSR